MLALFYATRTTSALPVPALVAARHKITDDAALTAPRARKFKLTKEVKILGAAGVAGWLLGDAVTPKIFYPNQGSVATPEAWRRRIKAKVTIPFSARAPRIFAVAAACFTLAEYTLALDESMAPFSKAALEHTSVVKVGRDVARRAAPRLAPFIEKLAPAFELVDKSRMQSRRMLAKLEVPEGSRALHLPGIGVIAVKEAK